MRSPSTSSSLRLSACFAVLPSSLRAAYGPSTRPHRHAPADTHSLAVPSLPFPYLPVPDLTAGVSKVKNAVHCTDLPEDGPLEVDYFFSILC